MQTRRALPQTQVVVLALSALSLVACDKKKDAETASPSTPSGSSAPVVTASASASASAVASASAATSVDAPASASAGVAAAVVDAGAPDAPAIDEMATLKPFEPKPEPQNVGTQKVTAEACAVEGGTFAFKSNMEALRSVRTIGDKLYVVAGDEAVHAFDIDKGAKCKLTIDKTFGENGVLKLDPKVRTLSADNKGVLVASNGVFASHRIKDGKVNYKCDVRPQGYVSLQPDGKFAIGIFANATVAKLTFDDKTCKSEKWVLQDMSTPATRKGRFSMVNAIGFMGDTILVGGALAKEVDPASPMIVAAMDITGKEKFTLGGGKFGTDEHFGWVHAIAPCKGGICVLDSNFRRMTLWKTDGKINGKLDLTKLFGVPYPWIADFTMGKAGAAYFTVGVTREKAKTAADGFIFRVTGLGT